MKPIIEVNNLSKRYSIGRRQSYGSLREEVSDAFSRPFRRIFSSSAGKAEAKEDTVWAIKDVSFNVAEGEIVGIIGRNGAGKSTLLKILSRITEPTEGRVVMRGRVASLLEVGTGFHPELTGRENIFLNGALLGMTGAEIKARFDGIVEFSEIDKFLDTPVKRYSSGMYVRLAFAVAAHLEPEILIVDEVLAVGDAAFQRKCLGKMSEAARGGRTVLFVSHNMGAVQRLCERAIVMHNGNVLKDSFVESAVASYLNISHENIGGRDDLYGIKRDSNEFSNIKFSKCHVLDSEGKVNVSLKYGEPFTVLLEAVSTTTHEDISLVVAADSITGVRVFTTVSEDFGVLYRAVPGEPLRAEVHFDKLVLTPGCYVLSIAIRSGKVGLDTLMNIIGFEVTAQAFGNITPHSGTFGLVSVDSEWRPPKSIVF
ncbi:MAG: ABC transporter ATP-binding protein [Deltaproteobacteria bacterium]